MKSNYETVMNFYTKNINQIHKVTKKLGIGNVKLFCFGKKKIVNKTICSDEPGTWKERIRGFEPNASRRSHSELAKRTSLDEGDEAEFGKLVSELKKKLPWVNILGGCCGTYLGHIESACRNVCKKH